MKYPITSNCNFQVIRFESYSAIYKQKLLTGSIDRYQKLVDAVDKDLWGRNSQFLVAMFGEHCIQEDVTVAFLKKLYVSRRIRDTILFPPNE